MKLSCARAMLALLSAILISSLSATSWAKSGSRHTRGAEPFRKGFTYLKWGEQFSEHADRSFEALKKTGTEWVSFVPIYYMDTTRSLDIYRHPILSPTDEALETAIRKAKALGFKILLKPHIDVMNDPWKSDWPGAPGGSTEAWLKKYRAFIDRYPISHEGTSLEKNWFRRLFDWRGEIRPEKDSDLVVWFDQYSKFITHFADMAARLNIELFCVGTEFERLSDQTLSWEAVIERVRKVYKGPVLYDVNHDGLTRVKFWPKLDFIGISAYYPIADRLNPSEQDLQKGMKAALDKVEKQVKDLEKKYGQSFPVLFSEAGYTDFAGTARSPWDFLLTDGVSPVEQARSYKVSLQAYKTRSWLKGVFFWRWAVEPEDKYFEYDHYSPYGKEAEQEIRKAWLPASSRN